MRLYSLDIQGFRRIEKARVLFGDATFLIGANNSAKSTVLKAVNALLSANKRLTERDYFSETDPESGQPRVVADNVVLLAEFRNLPKESLGWRGLKGRVLQYDVPEHSEETGLSIRYRKTFPLNKDVIIEILSKKRSKKAAYSSCRCPQDLIDAGLAGADVSGLFDDLERELTPSDDLILEALDDMWDLTDEEVWFKNPGGIPGNVLSKLPRFLLVPAEPSPEEIAQSGGGALAQTLKELFQDVRNESENYREAQKYLDRLEKELDPSDEVSGFGKMMGELNGVLCSVFPDTRIHAEADLSDPDKALVPSFVVQMSSNVRTSVEQQGTGMVRSAVFGLLRFRQRWLAGREDKTNRGLIIGFEEPEIYLHPSAANNMRDTIYDLSTGESQIIATTHSPFIIDLGRKPRQILNRFSIEASGVEVTPFSVTDEFQKLQETDREYVKMILKMDDHISRVFFTKTAVIVEGDTEDIVLRQTLQRLPSEQRLAIKRDFEIIRARGKAAIIGLVRYLRALGIDLHVVHDRDGGVLGAEMFNEPIRDVVGSAECITVLEECVEDVLGYSPPSKDKPHRAFVETEKWGTEWCSVPEKWRKYVTDVFRGYIVEDSSADGEADSATPR